MKNPTILKTGMACLALAVIGLTASTANAQYVLGSFQGAGDANNTGWINPNSGNPITSDAGMSFVAAGVPGYAQSLQITGTAGSFGSDSLELQFSAAQIAAFNANTTLNFTFSVPAWTNGGFSQIYNLALNAPGFGYQNIGDGGNAAATWGTYSTAIGDTGNNGNGEPNFYFYNGSPLQTQTVSFDYSSFLPAIIAGGEGYLQLTFQGNQGGGAPAYIYMNNVTLSVPEPASIALLGLGLTAGMVFLRRRNA